MLRLKQETPPDFSITLKQQSLSEKVCGELRFVMTMEINESGSKDVTQFYFRACRGMIQFLRIETDGMFMESDAR